jgi:hypothetical protein
VKQTLPSNFYSVISEIFLYFWNLQFEDISVNYAFFAKITSKNCQDYNLASFADQSSSLAVIKVRLHTLPPSNSTAVRTVQLIIILHYAKFYLTWIMFSLGKAGLLCLSCCGRFLLRFCAIIWEYNNILSKRASSSLRRHQIFIWVPTEMGICNSKVCVLVPQPSIYIMCKYICVIIFRGCVYISFAIYTSLCTKQTYYPQTSTRRHHHVMGDCWHLTHTVYCANIYICVHHTRNL